MNRKSGVTFIELLLVMSLLGIFLASFLPTFFKDLRLDKIAEASTQLEQLHQKTAKYFTELQPHSPWGPGIHCLPSPSGPTPMLPSSELAEVDFFDPTVEGFETWQAIGFNPNTVRFRYSMIPLLFGCSLSSIGDFPVVIFRAEGDLDGDGNYSVFEREATISQDHKLVPLGFLRVVERTE